MQLHQVKSKTKHKDKKRIGRGGKRGTYSGRGIKGQKARAGRKIRPQMRDVIKKLPKRRGYRFTSFSKKPAVLNLFLLDRYFSDNDKITPKLLFEKGLIKKVEGKTPAVKILGMGELGKKLTIIGCQVSKPAKGKIEKSGGNVK